MPVVGFSDITESVDELFGKGPAQQAIAELGSMYVRGVQMPIEDAPVFKIAAVYLGSCPLDLGNKPESIVVDSEGDERSICVVNRIMQSDEKERKGMIVV